MVFLGEARGGSEEEVENDQRFLFIVRRASLSLTEGLSLCIRCIHLDSEAFMLK